MRYIGIDLGGTRIKAGLVRDGAITKRTTKYLAPGDKEPAGITRLLRETISEVSSGDKNYDGVGIGVPGVVDYERGVICQSPNFPLWKNLPLRSMLFETVGITARIDNDANAIASGEAAYGAGRGFGSFICITLGSGVGGGLILDGKIYRGADGMAGEVGHMTIHPDGYPCTCGNRGCLEQYASRNGLKNMVSRDNLFGDLTDVFLKDPDFPERLYEAGKNGDEKIAGYFHDFGKSLGVAAGSLLNIFNVKLIVLCGGLSRSFDLFGRALLEEAEKRCFQAVWRGARIATGELGEDAGILGAASLCENQS